MRAHAACRGDRADTMNSNVAPTVREISEQVPITLLPRRQPVDAEMAGCQRVLQLDDAGQLLARRIIGRDAKATRRAADERHRRSHGRQHPAGQPYARQINLREHVNLSVLGWQRARDATPTR